MNKLTPHHLNAANDLSLDVVSMFDSALRRADKYASPLLNIGGGIDVLLSTSMCGVIPEDYCGGYTYNGHLLAVTVSDQDKVTEDNLFLTICHEMVHAARWQVNSEWENTLLDGLVFEGLATFFAIKAEVDNDLNGNFFQDTIARTPSEEINKLLLLVHPKLYAKYSDYNHDELFITGNDSIGLPRWAGYRLGYYLVGQYLKITGRAIQEAYVDNYADFQKVIGDHV